MPPADGSSHLANPSALTTTEAPSTLSGFLERNRFLLTFAVLSSLMGTSVGMAQVSASLYAGFFIALSIANADQAPTWNPGDEFEAARKQSRAKSPAP